MREVIDMVPLLVAAGAIWTYNIAKMVQISSRKSSKSVQGRSSRRSELMDMRSEDSIFPLDSTSEKNLTIFKDCTFIHEDRRIYNTFNNCTFNIFMGGKKDG